MYDILDISLAPSGRDKIDWVRDNMPLLRSYEEEFSKTRPFEGIRLALSIHLEAKTAYLCKVLLAGGAEMFVTGSNPLSTQDDVAAALAECGINVFARYGVTSDEYQAHLRKVIAAAPQIIIDDGGDLVHLIHTEFPQLLPNVIGGCEETTTGILRLHAMEKAGALRFPMIAVNDADCKHLFDNRYGTGQSVWDGINRTTNLIVAGKNVVVAGYGWCGKGVAMRAKGLGAKVYVTEVDPVKALEAFMDGFTVLPMDEAAALGDFFVTVTGCCDVITARHFEKMKDGAILCNAGHFNVEVDVATLAAMAMEQKTRRKNIVGYRLPDGRRINVLAEGRLVNLAAGDGHPAEIMDMSFAIQAMGALYLVQNNRGKTMPAGVIPVPREIDRDVAMRKLRFSGLSIDTLTEKQRDYLGSYDV